MWGNLSGILAGRLWIPIRAGTASSVVPPELVRLFGTFTQSLRPGLTFASRSAAGARRAAQLLISLLEVRGPQGLKPGSSPVFNGTAEAVPFHKTRALRKAQGRFLASLRMTRRIAGWGGATGPELLRGQHRFPPFENREGWGSRRGQNHAQGQRQRAGAPAPHFLLSAGRPLLLNIP